MNNSEVHIPKKLIPDKDTKIYLAISGGVDSVVLLHLLSKLENSVHLLHVNYHLRGVDSDEDAILVGKFANSLSIQCSVLDFDMRKHLENGGNLQAEARKIRYDFFKEHVSEKDILMTAHHFDDQMETFFMHLSRKSGIAGMSCMAEKNGNHVRPLLNFRKTNLYQYAKENELEFREDKSNLENKYLRNLWRNEWIPQLEKEIPTIADSIQTLINAFQKERLALEQNYSRELKILQETGKWSFESFETASVEGKHFIAREIGLRPTELMELEKLRNSDKSKRLDIERNDLTIWNSGNAFTFDYNIFTTLPELVIEEVKEIPASFTKDEIYVDPRKIMGELKIRLWKIGDRISPLGMKGSQLISGIIKDAKIPIENRKKVLIVEDNEEILWCVGLKVGRLGVADESSDEVWRVRMLNPPKLGSKI